MAQNYTSLETPQPNRMFKARIFEMIFRDKKELLELYNAVNGTHYDNPEDLIVNTLENAIYMAMYNDISFIIDLRLNLYEHQSTCNPNLPLRFLLYSADIYSNFTKDKNLYSSKIIPIPVPRFVVFYNGEEEQPDRKLLRLSDMYSFPDENSSLELTAVMLNINKGRNMEIMSACKTLADYSEYTFRIRSYSKEMTLDAAVERAISECIREGILSDFLSKNRAEAKKVSLYEYDQEKHMRQIREEAWEEAWQGGQQEGRQEGRQEGITIGAQEAQLDGIRNITIAFHVSVEKAMEALKIPKDKQAEYLSLLQK